MLGAAGAVASAGLVQTIAWAAPAGADQGDNENGRGRRGTGTAPNPIPGGFEVAPGVVLHVFGPGDPGVTLPVSGLPLGGFDVEPTTITDFRGSCALAYHFGTARGSDGKTYDLETDMRAFEGEFVVDGVHHEGAFAFV
jgi:hypothetical protein